LEKLTIDYKKVLARERTIVDELTSGVAALLRHKKVRVINGTASFVDTKSIKILETGEVT
jgi:dihydrolipoamide dehydrogenase